MSLAPLQTLARRVPVWLAAAAVVPMLALSPALAFKPPAMGGAEQAPPEAATPAPATPAPPAKEKRAAPAKPAKPAANSAPKKQDNSAAMQAIVALVNDEPITGYEVEQRMRLALLGTPELQKRMQAKLKAPDMDEKFKQFALKRLKANPPKTPEEQQTRVKQLQAEFVQSLRAQVEGEYLPVARKSALDELIDERIRMQEAKRLNVIAEEEEVDRAIKSMAERNKLTPDEFAEQIRRAGADIKEMRQRIKASMSWAAVIRSRFGRQIALAASDIERVVTTVGGPADVELRVQRILLPLSGDVSQQRVAQRLHEAEGLRARFSGCSNMNGLAAGVGGARFDDLGERRPSSIEEPTRSLLLTAQEGEMLPPTVSDGGVELWAVCGRKAIKIEGAAQGSGGDEVRQKEFEILSKKHMKDLRQDAHIEYRG